MAGIVKADIGHGLAGTQRRSIVPRNCPCHSNGSGTMLCAEANATSGWVNVCPFWYGARVHSSGMIGDIRDVPGLMLWLDFTRDDGRTWEVLCLRKESAGTIAGARLRD